MLKFLKKQANMAQTENGAATHAGTHSDCLDLFGTIGALRRQPEGDILSRFVRAYGEEPDLAMKILFFARDVRGGLGERRVFRVILRWMARYEPGPVRKNLPYIAEYGRFDDLLCLLDTPCEPDALALIKTQLEADCSALSQEDGQISLLAKWLPSVNTSNAEAVRAARKLARSLGMSESAYRKTLVKLRRRIHLLENNLRERDYTFDYGKQPSKALFKYRKAFQRNDGQRYQSFLEKVSAGKATLHTGTLAPYEIVRPFFDRRVDEAERQAINATWNALEDFTNGENALVVVDGSGSMYWDADPKPAAVAESLAVYFAQRNTGTFHNHFITFSTRPQLVEIKGGDLLDQLRYCCSFNECANPDIQKVFELLLNTAIQNHLPQSELPGTLYIISDMEFDACTENASLTNFQYVRNLFARAGYTLPRLVFWNVASRSRQQPVTMNEQGVALVSGCTPRVFGMLKSGILSPYAFMMETLGSERYAKIAA